ncbi:MAG: precorrin-3B C(17)-methyltransferase, partial [Actinomycetota bacterium]
VAAIRSADAVIGYRLYVDQCTQLLSARQDVVRSPIGAEVDRCREAATRAAAGQRVALVCSGDSGVFAMATLVFEVAAEVGNPPVHVVPGVTASLAAAAILGAPLAHDHALVSLSDLLTPWPLIERRLEALAAADFAVAFYNPRSQRRTMQLERAREILLTGRPASTPVGIVVNATRPGETVTVTTLGDLNPADVDMFSIVVVGSSTTELRNGKMVTPRGYDA